MIFDGKPASQITPADIRRLRDERTQEDQFLDYKRDPYPANEAGKREMIKDVSAFANAAGGYILIGVDEDGEGRASAITGVTDASGVQRSIVDRCLTLIEPRLTQLDVSNIDVDGRTVIVCYIPESGQKPHAAIPDREHHYFYQRYQAGVKLMTVTEVRHALQGDAVQREIAELRRELAAVRHRETIEQELDQDVDEQGLLRLESPEAVAHHAERLFRRKVGDRPYFRVTATPSAPNVLNLRDERDRLYQLLSDPPRYRDHGFDVGARYRPDIRQTAWGLERQGYEYKHLRLFWNGHLEFWNPADDDWISWAEAPGLPVVERPFAPLGLIESSASFVLLAKAIAEQGHFTGEIAFQLGLYHVKGRRILPFAPNTYGHMFAARDLAGQEEFGVFHDDDVHGGPVRERVANLPGTVAFRLISEVYFQLGYVREQIPYFDQNNRFVNDVEAEQRAQGGK